ncbi:SGNH/GDSL hydrolase family protein [Sphingomonas sp.]|uniref:SGNH/GDSL hydrolase family protein n=1 Tax=Sphingomonas sp. TaxID=28214 RepID=UPI002BFACEF7|nr:SGNH/GDSL hydrolase family protein [Sphingomonas sp.]HTG39539.1 SGNH/GDSL hydrolase family protein [Sphingomonas sp.]
MRAIGLAVMLAMMPGSAWAQTCAWQPAWASAQMVPGGDNRLAPGALDDASLRQVARMSTGGKRVRVRISNAFGTKPLEVRGASIARPVRNDGHAVTPDSLVPLRFAGQPGTRVPAGADWLSDPVAMPVAAFDDLAVTLHVAGEPGEQTSHPGSRATSWLAKGDATRAATLTGAQPTEHWFLLSGIEVEACPARGAVVVLGDSITDGRGSTTNGNDRWTDVLARRLQADPRTRGMSVLNQGIGGNNILVDGLGPNAIARLDRDVLALPRVTDLIVLEGVNDLGGLSRTEGATQADYQALVGRLTAAFSQIIERAQARGIRIHGATVMPFGASEYYHATPDAEAARRAINDWIRTPGRFDSVIDMDRATADPARPDRLDKRYDEGDGLHTSPAGFRRMAEEVDLTALVADRTPAP